MPASLSVRVTFSHVSETALINDAKRGATVISTGPVSTFYLERDDFEALFGKSRLNVQFAKRQAISAEQVGKGGGATADGAASTSAPPNAVRDKDHAAVHMISNVMVSGQLETSAYTRAARRHAFIHWPHPFSRIR
jgi:hypothetical protein